MEISIVERKGKTYTRFKITQKEMREAFIRRMVKGLKPIKENSRFVYFEIEGDLLNKDRTKVMANKKSIQNNSCRL